MNLGGKNIHFMGVGGIGMSALAGIALEQGAIVTGCDRSENEQVDRLRVLGADIVLGHSIEHGENCGMLVYTSAVPLDHPEVIFAGDKAIKRGTFLAKLMSEFRGVGICGTHGKTSTTWMVAHILIEMGLDPTVLLGGVTATMRGNYRCGGNIFVSELDESDGSFLEPELGIAVILNIESEHLAYYRTSEKVVEAFEKFAEKNNSGLLILGIDNEHCAKIYNSHSGRKKAFGLNTSGVGLYASDIYAENGSQYAQISYDGRKIGQLSLPLCGEHNVLNALAALLSAEELGVSIEDGMKSLESIKTVGRRMELIHSVNKTKIYSDYAHHPTEVRAALQGAKELDRNGKVLAVFQPHLFSRTRDYALEFAKELSVADGVVVVEIYPAREELIPGISSEIIRQEIRNLGGNVSNQEVEVEDICSVIKEYVGQYSTIICIGAGDIDTEVRKIANT